MRVLNVTAGSRVYTSNAYLVTGTHNAMDDVNGLVDVGRDPSAIENVNRASTGVGKKRVERVVLTHSHYDHAGLLPKIRELFCPEVCAFSRSLDGVDRFLRDGDVLELGDRLFEVIHTPGHSNDSICLYCGDEKTLFVGDHPLLGLGVDGSYDERFLHTLEKLSRKDVRTIYPGHGEPVTNNIKRLLYGSLENVRQAMSAPRSAKDTSS